MGQCGQGNFNSPIRKPVKVINLEGVPVHQISAGTSHSIVWTAVPSNRLVLCFRATLSIVSYRVYLGVGDQNSQ